MYSSMYRSVMARHVPGTCVGSKSRVIDPPNHPNLTRRSASAPLERHSADEVTVRAGARIGRGRLCDRLVRAPVSLASAPRVSLTTVNSRSLNLSVCRIPSRSLLRSPSADQLLSTPSTASYIVHHRDRFLRVIPAPFAAPQLSVSVAPPPVVMSSEFSPHVIQRDIDAKKAKLEALKAKRLARLAAQADETNVDRPGAISPVIESPPRTVDNSFASELDRNLSLHDSTIDGGVSHVPSLNVSLNDSFISVTDRESGAAAMLSPSSATSPSGPSTFSRTLSTKRYPTLRLSNNEQLLAIKHSLDEITQHSNTSGVASSNKRISCGLTAELASTVAPPLASLDVTIASAAESLNNSVAAPATSTSSSAAPTDPQSQSAMIDDLLAQIQSLSESVRSKNEDLVMAGDLGSVLLQNNEDANQRIEELQAMLNQHAAELFNVKDEVRAGERKAKKLQLHLNESQHLQQEAESEAEILRMELELERQKVRQTEMDLIKAQADRSEQESLAELGAQLAEMKQSATKMDQQLADARRARDESDQALANLQEEHADLQSELRAAEKFQQRAQELQEQLQVLKAQDTVNVLAELQWENQRMVEAMQELTQQYEVLQESNARDQELLRNLQSKNEVSRGQNMHAEVST
jgi:hypothetical protein